MWVLGGFLSRPAFPLPVYHTTETQPNYESEYAPASKPAFVKSWWSKKLEDRRWQEKRNHILARDKYTCQSCRDSEDTSILHVHHRYYKFRTDPWDYPNEALITLCKGCHTAATDYNGVFDATLKCYFSPDDLLDVAALINQFHRCEIPPAILLAAFEELLCDDSAFFSLLESRLSMSDAANGGFSKSRKSAAIRGWLASRKEDGRAS